MIDGIVVGDLSIDCKDPKAQCEFYSKLLNLNSGTAYGCPSIVLDNGLVVLFMACDFDYEPPMWPEVSGMQQKQMHFNFQVDDLKQAVEFALSIGATLPKEQYGGEHFITLIDPEGHPFCLCKKRN